MRKISNPLTIIGMFAGIAEVSGTVVLPFVSQNLQHIFIWYVMGFPVALVFIFFITLNFNTKSLYAPGDFSDEENFMKLVNKTIDKKINEVKTENPAAARELEDVKNELNDARKTHLIFKRREILDYVTGSNNGVTLKEVADKFNITRANAIDTMSILIKDGYIERVPNNNVKAPGKFIAKK